MRTVHIERGLSVAIVCLFSLALWILPAAGQSFYGSIVGTVTDVSGAVVPGAAVTVTDIATNEVHTAKSDASGQFSFVDLVPANYKVEIQAAGFKSFIRTPVQVQVGVATRVDAGMDVGAVTETVEITTQVPLLQTDSGQLSQEVEGTTVQQMPLNGRNTMNLIALTAGVVPQGASMGSTAANQNSGNTNNTGWGNYQIGGGIANQSAEYLDGVAIDVLGNTVAFVPTQDAVQEFNVASNAVSADFGRFSGGVVNMTTKSGTNAFHGTAYEYARNTDFNANDWFNKRTQFLAGTPDTPLKFIQNQYGAAGSGPIKKNKAFFLFTWESSNIRFSQYSPTNVPTTDMLAAKVPYIAAAAGVNTGATDGNGNAIVKVTDPLGNCTPVQNNTYNYWDLSKCSINAAAAQMLQYFPPVSATSYGYNGPGKPYGTWGTSAYNYPINIGIGTDQTQYNGRVDYTLSDKQRIFGRYSYWHLGDIPFDQFPSVTKYNVGNGATVNNTNTVVLGDTYTINSSTVLDARVSWLREHYDTSKPQTNVNESAFFPNDSFTSQEQTGLPPTFTLNNQRSLFSAWSRGPFNKTVLSNEQISANIVKLAGRHSFKVGTELRLMEGDNTGSPSSGSFTYNGNYTGDEWADFLLGYAKSGSIAKVSAVSAYNYYQAYYVQDNFRFSNKLTLNLGLRYEFPGSIAEKNNKLLELLPSAIDPYTGVTGTLVFVDSPLYGYRTIQKSPKRLIAPRTGFAYRVMNNLVLSGGYGVAFLPPDLFFNGAGPSSSSINSATTPLTNTAPLTPGNVANGSFVLMSNPFPNGLIAPSGRSNPAFMVSRLFTSAISGAAPTSVYPYNQQWNLSLSRQMKGNWMVEAGYVGATGTHLPAMAGGLDELPKAFWNNWVPNPTSPSQVVNSNLISDCTLTTPIGGYSKTVTRGQCHQPYPYYSNFTDANPYWGSTTYNSLQIRSEKRFQNGGVLMASYTWAKMIGNTDSLSSSVEPKASNSSTPSGYGQVEDPSNHRGERSILSFNVPNRAVISYVIPLPFGQGQRFMSSLNGGLSRVVSGWAINGITTFQSGFALGLQENPAYALTSTYGYGTMRPDYVPGCNKSVPGSTRQRLNEWFNTACYQAPGTSLGTPPGAPAGTLYWALGDDSRVDGGIHSEGIDDWDASLVKATRLTERTNLEFRGEFFNLFNRTQFAPPYINRGASQFGTVVSQENQPRLVQLSLRLNF